MPHYNTIPQKTCTKCCQEFPATTEYFYRDNGRRDGLYSWCKSCAAESRRAWSAANQERLREIMRDWRTANREHVREYDRAYNVANREHRREHKRAKYLANQEREREKARARYAENREGAREKHRVWIAANPDRDRVYGQNRRARKRALPDTFTVEQSQFAFEYWNGCCVYCGRQFRDLFGERVLAFDHFIPLNSPDCPGTTALNMLPACHGVDSCNSSKHATNPEQWLISRFGKKAARARLSAIEVYFSVVKDKFNGGER